MDEVAIEPQMGLNFELVWAALMELRATHKESSADFDRRLKETERLSKESSADFDRRLKETERLLKESSADFDRRLKESSADFDRRIQETDRLLKENGKEIKELSKNIQETDRLLKENGKEIKELSKNIGGLNNSLGELVEKMFSAQLWNKFDALGYKFTKGHNVEFTENKHTIAEVDVFLENGEYAMPVEVKTHLKVEDVNKHIERIERIRGYMDRHGDKRRLLGAVAGGIVPEEVKDYAQRLGLYVLEQSGESVTMAETPEGFTARIWASGGTST